MKLQFTAICLAIGTLFVPLVARATDADSDRTHPGTYVKDSVITTKIKAKLADEKLSSLAHISVDTDNKGAVVLSGTARTEADAKKAVSIARKTEGVTSVKSDIQIKKDD